MNSHKLAKRCHNNVLSLKSGVLKIALFVLRKRHVETLPITANYDNAPQPLGAGSRMKGAVSWLRREQGRTLMLQAEIRLIWLGESTEAVIPICDRACDLLGKPRFKVTGQSLQV